MRLRREPSVSIRKKYRLKPRVLRMALFVKIPLNVFCLARPIFRLILRYYSNCCLSAQYTISMNNLCHKTCRVMFIKMTAKSKFLLAHPKMAQLVKIPFIVFHLARLIFTGQTSHSDMTYLKHSSFFRIFYLSIDLYSRTVMSVMAL